MQVKEKNIELENSIYEFIEQVNNTEKEFRDNVTIHKLFEEQVNKNSSETAVICEHGKSLNGKDFLTYEELNKLSNQLAHRLRVEGVCPDKIGEYAQNARSQ